MVEKELRVVPVVRCMASLGRDWRQSKWEGYSPGVGYISMEEVKGTLVRWMIRILPLGWGGI